MSHAFFECRLHGVSHAVGLLSSNSEVQSQVLALEQKYQILEAKLFEKTQQDDAATAQNAELAEQVQVVTKSVKDKCALAVREAERKIQWLEVRLPLLLMHTSS